MTIAAMEPVQPGDGKKHFEMSLMYLARVKEIMHKRFQRHCILN